MKKLLSLPPNLVECFHDVTGLSRDEYFCSNDPVGHKLGSGGGTAWLLRQAAGWLGGERSIILHAGGQSRRLPAYAPSGKILTPIPVFRWERGQRLGQDLLSLQLPLYEKIMAAAPSSLTTMIVSGDVYIRSTQPLQPVPEADVVCYGLWLGPEIAKDHGVFVSSRNNPTQLKCMLQKPSPETLKSLLSDNFYLTDIGIWMFSDKALKLLVDRSTRDGEITEYDMYSDFGCALGTDPAIDDEEIKNLKVAILPLPGGEFYHFGTSHELLSSTLAVQNLVNDQRDIIHLDMKPHPAIFVQNAVTKIKFRPENRNVWIENSFVGPEWSVSQENIITGVPENDWQITLQPGQCVDIVPVGDEDYVVRPYGYNDKFAGKLQQTPMFPVVRDIKEMGEILKRMIGDKDFDAAALGLPLLSAEEITAKANLRRLTQQRKRFRADNWPALAANYEHSVFYQIDLEDAAKEFAEMNVAMPAPAAGDAPLMTRIHDAMFRSELHRRRGEEYETEEKKAFGLLGDGLTASVRAIPQCPKMNVYGDQIVWARSPVRIDLAGGWTDTPPYCLVEGGTVINVAIELNGQPPLQTYIRPCKEHHIILRSIDLGAAEEITEYGQLDQFNKVGSPFSIPKAALVLAGFSPRYSSQPFGTLQKQLEAFGCGFEVTLLSAIPAGSGLGTSSVLAATVLGAVNDFCGLAWDNNEICRRTLVLEQMLTTGGGWQDQFGGVLPGLKLLQTSKGFDQSPVVRWLPDDIYTRPEYQQCHLLYYTGITRTAKKILSEIVRRMFLNSSGQVAIQRDMKAHAMDMYDVIQRADFRQFGALIRKTWMQNQSIDSGTNPPEVNRLTTLIDDLCLGYKLPGAGGGGYMYMVAKDPEAAVRIKKILTEHQPNKNARFVDMSLSRLGLQVSRS